MEFETSFPADGEALELVEQGEGLLDDVAELAQALDVRGALAGYHRQDASAPQFMAHGLGVVRLIAQDRIRPSSWSVRPTGDGRDAVDEIEDLGDVVDVSGGRDDVQRGAVPVADQVVFAARFRRSTGGGPVAAPPFSCECGSRPRMRGSSRVRRPRASR